MNLSKTCKFSDEDVSVLDFSAQDVGFSFILKVSALLPALRTGALS